MRRGFWSVLIGLALAVAAIAGSGCKDHELICMADTDCVAEQGNFGSCLDHHCAFKDTTCPETMLRFDDNAGADADACVTPAQLPDAGPPAADAH